MKINRTLTGVRHISALVAMVVLSAGCGGGDTGETEQVVTDRVNQNYQSEGQNSSEYEREDDKHENEREEIDDDRTNQDSENHQEDEKHEETEENDDKGGSDTGNNSVEVAIEPGKPPTGEAGAGRLLASQCAQCHGTEGYSSTDIDSLAGESYNELEEEMLEMRLENDNDLMHFQARGYTDAQISLIANYFSSLPKPAGESHDD